MFPDLALLPGMALEIPKYISPSIKSSSIMDAVKSGLLSKGLNKNIATNLIKPAFGKVGIFHGITPATSTIKGKGLGYRY